MSIKFGILDNREAQSAPFIGSDARKRLNDQLLANLEGNSSVGSHFVPTTLSPDYMEELQMLAEEASQKEAQYAIAHQNHLLQEYEPEVPPTPAPRSEMMNALVDNLSQKQSLTYDRPREISRSQRGTIEFVIQEDGLTLTPQYNRCGILTGIVFGDGTKLAQSGGDGPWSVISSDTYDRLNLPIQSVAFDKKGNLTIKAQGRPSNQ